MKIIYANNVNGALRRGVRHLKEAGMLEDSRNGPVLVAPTPVVTVYKKPWQRVLFNPTRDANPFFHLMEALWMLAGRQDVAYPAHYAAQLQLYSDDNETLNGAYGYRWRNHFGYDQLEYIIKELKANPASRRCVLALWDGFDAGEQGGYSAYEGDLKRALAGGKDVPCNTHVYFRMNDGKLEMTVCNRSNDAVWGTYGANAVHFSMLQEYLAGHIGCPVGRYYQVANNFHAYITRPDVVRLWTANLYTDMYKTGKARSMSMISFGESPRHFDYDMEQFTACTPGVDGQVRILEPRTAFFRYVVHPMARAHNAYKDDDLQRALTLLNNVPLCDWTLAGDEWVQRRIDARLAKRGAE